MNNKKVAIGMTHGHAPKWLQISMNSLKSVKNDIESDIFVATSWPGHASIKAITENDLGNNVTIIPCTIRIHSHATGLDQILDHIADKGYEWLLAMETDCRVCKDGWLDWFTSFMINETVGIAGFFWEEGNNHYNINPSFTIYNVKMLLKYHKEVRENKENTFYHPRGNRDGNEQGMDSSIKDVAGIFSETRGIKNPTPTQRDMILRGVPQAAWFEPGAYLYYRHLGEFGGTSIPCDHIYMKYGRHTAPEGTYYGGKADPFAIHYWGGTRCYDFLKHPVDDQFVKECAPYWMKREDRIWKENVPEKYRSIVYDIHKEIDMRGLMQKNLGTIVDEII